MAMLPTSPVGCGPGIVAEPADPIPAAPAPDSAPWPDSPVHPSTAATRIGKSQARSAAVKSVMSPADARPVALPCPASQKAACWLLVLGQALAGAPDGKRELWALV